MLEVGLEVRDGKDDLFGNELLGPQRESKYKEKQYGPQPKANERVEDEKWLAG